VSCASISEVGQGRFVRDSGHKSSNRKSLM